MRATAIRVAAALRPVEARYVGELRKIARAYVREYEKAIVPRLGDIARKDAVNEFRSLPADLEVLGIRIRAALAREVGRAFDKMAKQVVQKNTEAMTLFGISLGSIQGNTGVITNTGTGLLRDIAAAREQNIALVENAHRVYAASVRAIVHDPATFGQRVETVKARLLERGDVTESRAELIARDQTLKLNGQINQTRQMRAGVDRYTWSTSNDDRVRESHATLEGQVFSWDAPPEVGHPGEDFQCRCVALPVVDELEGVFG